MTSPWVRRALEESQRAGRAPARLPVDERLGDFVPADLPGCTLCWTDFITDHPTDHAHEAGSREEAAEGGSQ